jgi:hypothetical protein
VAVIIREALFRRHKRAALKLRAALRLKVVPNTRSWPRLPRRCCLDEISQIRIHAVDSIDSAILVKLGDWLDGG